jgi:hypothetical protein
VDRTEDLSLEKGLAEILIYMKEDDLAVTTADTDLICSDSYDVLDTLGAYILSED